ncbi:MAG: SMP-30/gluconolactonase/LRE family protein [Candidatus Methanoculleus thermohydrogenotrophicum]
MASALLAFLLTPLLSAIYVDVPDYETGIASAGVKDAINGRFGDVIFATDSGISIYMANGTWYSVNARHPGETAYGMLAPLNVMMTAVALDSEGHLWIGYPNGLQFQTETGYEAIQDQQFLKNLNINCMVRWGDEIWVATGRAGLHRYHDGDWTWYKPLGPENLGCYSIVSMAVDAASGALVIGSDRDGIWVLRDRIGEVRFEPVLYTKDRDFDIPSGIAADASGNIYVADSGNYCIQKFDSSGNLLATWGGRYGGFSSVDDIAADASGNIYAVDRRNHCIQKFDGSGKFLTTWGTRGTGDGEFRCPAGIAVNAAGDVYVTDSGNHRIQKFDSSGKFLTTWGSYGTGDDEFQWPSGIAIDASGNVYVADTDANRIKIFDSSGNSLKTWQFWDTGGEIFHLPSDIASDASGNIYVVNKGSHCVQKFAPLPDTRSIPDTRRDSGTPSYTFVTKWGTKAYQGKPVREISEVRVDPFGGVYLFNRTTVLWYAPDKGITPVLDVGDLSAFLVTINDIAATPEGTLLIASDNGIYGWNESAVVLHITSEDGIRSNVVKKLFIDAYGRCWFVVPGNVGYIPLMTGSVTLDLKPESVQASDVLETTPNIPDDIPAPEETPRGKPSGVIGMLEDAWASLVERIGNCWCRGVN